MLKKIILGFVILAAVVVGAVFFLGSNIDSIVRAAIEKYGSAATQTEVRLDSVKLSLTSGEGSLNGLSVGNPKGFSPAKAFNLGSVSVKLDTGSIAGNGPVVIRDIDIEQPQVSFELTNGGNTNLQTIQNNLLAYVNGAAGSGNASGAGDGGKPARKIIINDLTIHNGQVSISQESLQGRQLSAPLPTIHLTDIGKNSGGATAAQVAEQVIGSIGNAASQVALTDLAKEKIGGALSAVPGAAIVGGAVGAATTQVKGLLGQ